MKFYTSIEEGSKLKGRKFWGLIPTFAEVTEENLVGGRGMGGGGGVQFHIESWPKKLG